jgi:hypothetical protein
MKRLLTLLFLVGGLVLRVGFADAHGGGLNRCGCHVDHKTGQCHCHQNRGCGCECSDCAVPEVRESASKGEARAQAKEDADLHRFLAKHTRSFRKARGDEKKLRVAITRYLEEGNARHMSPLELRDHFDISSPGLLEKAGLNEQECERGAKIFEEVAAKLFGN